MRIHSVEYGIVDHLIDHARKSPNRIIFSVIGNEDEGEKNITYLELESRVKELSSRLTDRNLKGKRALLIYQDTVEFIISFLACICSGTIPVPVSYAKGTRQLARLVNIMENAQATAILCVQRSIPYLQQGLPGFLESGNIELLPTDLNHPLYEIPFLENPSYNAISFIQYTSGSTNNPKGVVITKENLIKNQQLIKNIFGCDTGSVIFSWLPFHHDMGLIGNLLHTIYVGCTCILMSPFHFMQRPQRWLEGITKYKATHSGGPNFAYDLCADSILPDELSKLNLSRWEIAYNGSEPIRADTIRRFTDYFTSVGFRPGSFRPCYGLAEATLLVSGHRHDLPPAIISIERGQDTNGKIVVADPTDSRAQLVTGSGQIPSGMEVRIISLPGQRICAELEEGEICISGESVTKGYWNMDNANLFYELEGKSFLRTGDLGFLCHGDLFVHGRLKEMLIIRGQNFYPQDIEQVAFDSNIAVEHNAAAVFSIDDREERFVIVAEVKRTLIKGLDIEQVISSIGQAVNDAFGISPYDIVLTTPHGIPRTTSGKLQRTKCKDIYHGNAFPVLGSKLQLSDKMAGKDKAALLPAEVIRKGDYDTIKRYVADAVGTKIGYWPADLLDSKTDLAGIGIDSLKAMELINGINKELGINIDAAIILRDNSFQSLISNIENKLWLKNTKISGTEITI
jgi:acyl-CoA synthetase (AMP-forming)/AMP-acid ligase II/acyl carrier protein